MAGTLAKARSDSIGAVHETVRVSRQQRAVLEALADGARSAEIAARINVSSLTVEAHVRVLFEKFRARSRPHLVAQAFRSRVLKADPRNAGGLL